MHNPGASEPGRNASQRECIPTILFGAFDRHNFGDLLFPHIAAALLPAQNLLFAGLAERDLRCHGGHRVLALARLAAGLGNRPVNLIHAGGELLGCDAWQAAVMLLPPDQVQPTIARLDAHPEEKAEWARNMLGTPALAPYTVSGQLFPRAHKIIYNSVGGIDLVTREAAFRAEVWANLSAADAVSVRDKQTLAQLQAAGITARLTPDPAVMVAELFGTQIRQRADESVITRILQTFPQGYIAVQFSADFGDDATLAAIAAQLDETSTSSGYGVVFFRAGAAPWHDDQACFQRVAARMHTPAAMIFESLHLWDICALIANSRAYCGSSLHGRIVATAFALPRVNLLHPAQENQPTKQAAYAATWEAQCMPGTVQIHGLARGMHQALMADPQQLQHTATELAALYRRGFNTICAGLM